MKRILIFLALAGAVVTLIGGLDGPCTVNAATAQDKKELILLNWSEYMDPELLVKFENRYGIHIKEVYYESESLRDEMLVESESRGYDLVVGSGISLLPHVRRGWLAEVDLTSVPNLKHINPRWKKAHPQLEGMAAPFFWGTLGIGYRSDKIKEVSSWRQLLEPEEALRKRIVMIKDSRDLFTVSLKMLGYSLNSSDPAHFEQAGRHLLAQKPFVQDYSYMLLDRTSEMVAGDIWMALMYNGDALVLQDYHPSISYTVPREGTHLWVDYLAILSHSRRQASAARFINFLHEPVNAAQLSSFLMYATTNQAAEKMLPKEIVENPFIYPPPEVLERSEIARELPPRIVRKCNTIFNRLIH